MCVYSTNLGFSGEKNCACVRLILVLVGGRQTAIVVARYDSMIPGTYYVPDTYVPHFMIPGTYYVPDTYDTRYVLCTRYVCTTLAVVLLYSLVGGGTHDTYVPPKKQLYRYFEVIVYSLMGGGITRTFRPWTHTSDAIYIYQLSLVVATATVSLVLYFWNVYVDRTFARIT